MTMTNDDAQSQDVITTAERLPWTAPVLTKLSTVSEILAGGGGKLSLAGGDPGDGLKQSGGEVVA
jgi:hypothetical protein